MATAGKSEATLRWLGLLLCLGVIAVGVVVWRRGPESESAVRSAAQRSALRALTGSSVGEALRGAKGLIVELEGTPTDVLVDRVNAALAAQRSESSELDDAVVGFAIWPTRSALSDEASALEPGVLPVARPGGMTAMVAVNGSDHLLAGALRKLQRVSRLEPALKFRIVVEPSPDGLTLERGSFGAQQAAVDALYARTAKPRRDLEGIFRKLAWEVSAAPEVLVTIRRQLHEHPIRVAAYQARLPASWRLPEPRLTPMGSRLRVELELSGELDQLQRVLSLLKSSALGATGLPPSTITLDGRERLERPLKDWLAWSDLESELRPTRRRPWPTPSATAQSADRPSSQPGLPSPDVTPRELARYAQAAPLLKGRALRYTSTDGEEVELGADGSLRVIGKESDAAVPDLAALPPAPEGVFRLAQGVVQGKRVVLEQRTVALLRARAQVVLFDANGGRRESAPFINLRQLTLASDGTRAYFVAEQDGVPRLVTLALDALTAELTTPWAASGPSHALFLGLTHDGALIAVLGDNPVDHRGRLEVWQLAGPGGARRIARLEGRLTLAGGITGTVADGALVVAVQGGNPRNPSDVVGRPHELLRIALSDGRIEVLTAGIARGTARQQAPIARLSRGGDQWAVYFPEDGIFVVDGAGPSGRPRAPAWPALRSRDRGQLFDLALSPERTVALLAASPMVDGGTAAPGDPEQPATMRLVLVSERSAPVELEVPAGRRLRWAERPTGGN